MEGDKGIRKEKIGMNVDITSIYRTGICTHTHRQTSTRLQVSYAKLKQQKKKNVLLQLELLAYYQVQIPGHEIKQRHLLDMSHLELPSPQHSFCTHHLDHPDRFT
jgi:hypothetical protein